MGSYSFTLAGDLVWV